MQPVYLNESLTLVREDVATDNTVKTRFDLWPVSGDSGVATNYQRSERPSLHPSIERT